MRSSTVGKELADAGEAQGPLDRYAGLLELIASFHQGLTLGEVAALSGLPKTSAQRLLKGLVRSGLAAGGEGGRPYRIGGRLSRILHATAAEGWLETLVRPVLVALAAGSGEACYLTRLAGHRVVVAMSEAPEVRWRSYVQPGIEMPPHAAATAKAILAHQEGEIVRRALAVDLPRLTVNTRCDEAAILSDYETVRQCGHASCVGEIDEGLAALAVPVVQPDGQVLHAVGMTGPLARIMSTDMPGRIAALRAAAGELGGRLALGARLQAGG